LPTFLLILQLFLFTKTFLEIKKRIVTDLLCNHYKFLISARKKKGEAFVQNIYHYSVDIGSKVWIMIERKQPDRTLLDFEKGPYTAHSLFKNRLNHQLVRSYHS